MGVLFIFCFNQVLSVRLSGLLYGALLSAQQATFRVIGVFGALFRLGDRQRLVEGGIPGGGDGSGLGGA
ncbi:hypothetical protein A3194_20620 [Candidatus Thiodiazotropha endoloripes]|nr:hypothetical protein A3194_20620 [Candidatus Thiodiazotropha endoloripes]